MSGYWATYGYHARDERVAWVDSAEPGIHCTLRGLGNEILREVHELNGSWSLRKDYLYAGKEHIATIDGAGVKHVHKDHLGSTRLVTSATGSVLSQHNYWPFGEEMTVTSSPERMRFAGHERDLTSFLDYMHARFYAPWGGRFLSVDPGRDDDVHKPQSFNLYAYVRNNPVNAVDPTGKEKTGFEKDIYEAFLNNPRPATPEQRAFEIGIGGALVGLITLPVAYFLGPETATAAGMGAAVNLATVLPDVLASPAAIDAKVNVVVGSLATGGVAGTLPIRPVPMAVGAAASSLVSQHLLCGGQDGAAVATHALAAKGALVAAHVATLAQPRQRPVVAGAVQVVVDLPRRFAMARLEDGAMQEKHLAKVPSPDQLNTSRP